MFILFKEVTDDGRGTVTVN